MSIDYTLTIITTYTTDLWANIRTAVLAQYEIVRYIAGD